MRIRGEIVGGTEAIFIGQEVDIIIHLVENDYRWTQLVTSVAPLNVQGDLS